MRVHTSHIREVPVIFHRGRPSLDPLVSCWRLSLPETQPPKNSQLLVELVRPREVETLIS